MGLIPSHLENVERSLEGPTSFLLWKELGEMSWWQALFFPIEERIEIEVVDDRSLFSPLGEKREGKLAKFLIFYA